MTHRHALYVYASALLMTVTSCNSHSQDKTAQPGEAPRIEVTEAVTDSVTLYKEYSGTIAANRSVEIVARVNGVLSKPMYETGGYVKAGQTLFTINSDTYTNALHEAEAALATARSDNEYAEEHYTAVAKAFESHAVSRMEVAQALSSRDQSRAAIKSAQARVADARDNVAKCTVKAPLSGHISTNTLSGGSYVSGEGSPVTLATLYDDATVSAHFAIEDALFLRMFENPDSSLRIDYSAIPIGFSEKLPHDYTADLSYLAPNVDTSTGTLNIHAGIDNPYGELRAGMYCTIRMPYQVDPEAILVRDASLSTDQLGKYLYVVNDSNRVVYTPVTVGDMANDSMRIVTAGLKPSDKYVKSAMLKVRDGMTVTPVLTK